MGETDNWGRGLFWLAFTVLVWGAYMPVGRAVGQHIDVYWVTFARYLFAGVLIVGYLAVREGASVFSMTRGDFWRVLALGALGSAGFGLFSYLAVRYTRPEHAAAISALTPIHVALWRAARTRAFPPPRVALTVVAVVFGEVLVLTHGDLGALRTGGGLYGDLLALIASLCWTFYTIGAQALRGFSALRLTGLACLFGSPIGLAVALAATAFGATRPFGWSDVVAVWPQLVYLFVGVSLISIVTWNIAVRDLGAQNATLMAAFVPVIPFAWAFMQGQRFSASELFGVALILVAIVAHNLGERRSAPS
ncbi:MAG: DMT family transporter [Hyphomicrobiales bacterium]|nr:DMT family transporter [Hyphomicrobiales bacterium]